ncbi:cell division protein FtsQ/DivIB [Chryseobacterium taiwanense]|uniref:Cell division protein FtsQ n=1 Tax=Chryseobacterium taiwanense TaxID=363331 RepID=A0A0B4DC23_9FLAO|nr:hypothetical protein [Chryseobacterium taiwanense]KIC61870.1 cell division protein FtsQ [Chryseobacterium taiwanense]
MKNKYRILKIAITVIILGFLLSFSLKKFSGQKITDNKISVKMNEKTPVYFIDEKDIREIVKKENPSGKVGDLNIPALEKKINNLPAVDSANVYLNLNGKLNLDIKQRVPIFRLNKEGRDFYVDEKGTEFPISKTYSHPCMLVTGDVQKNEYQKLAELVEKIDKDDFSKKYFIGISKDHKGSYNLLTSEGNYKVEIGDLDNIEFKVKGFKAFVEKYLVYQDPQKYSKVSVKYQNQIVTTLNPYFKENDSILNVGNKELAKASTTPSSVRKTVEVLPKTAAVKKPSSTSSKPKASSKPKEAKKTEKKAAATKPKAKVKIE